MVFMFFFFLNFFSSFSFSVKKNLVSHKILKQSQICPWKKSSLTIFAANFLTISSLLRLKINEKSNKRTQRKKLRKFKTVLKAMCNLIHHKIFMCINIYTQNRKFFAWVCVSWAPTTKFSWKMNERAFFSSSIDFCVGQNLSSPKSIFQLIKIMLQHWFCYIIS